MIADASVLAVAGRRIDAPDASAPRFPSQNVARVERELAALFEAHPIRAVVGSAACGADILILEAARQRGLRTHIILPFDAARFRETSVVDRGGDWGPRYDLALAHAQREGRVIVIAATPGIDDDAYARATEVIFEQTLELARELRCAPAALAVWDQNPRSSADATQQFLDLAKQHEFECLELSTL
jgi:hypothetical protein